METKITWNDVKIKPTNKRKYILAYGDENVGTGLFTDGKWYLYGKESENGEWIEAPAPYAWAAFPDAPARNE